MCQSMMSCHAHLKRYAYQNGPLATLDRVLPRQTDGQDYILSQADTLTKNRSNFRDQIKHLILGEGGLYLTLNVVFRN